MTTLYGKKALEELNSSIDGWELLADGGTAKGNHYGCEAGIDRKQRFNVKRVDNSFIWHCYHCNMSGFYVEKEAYHRMGTHKVVDETRPSWETLYESATDEFEFFPERSQLWLAAYGFDDKMCKRYGIRATEHYSAGEQTLLPIISNMDMVGLQLRNHRTGKGVPKYVTYKEHNAKMCLVGTLRNDTIFITEDLLSAYKLHYAGATVVCSMGTNPPTGDVLFSMPRFRNIMIWLDDDDAGHTGTHRIHRELAYTGAKIYMLTHGRREPKETSLVELKEIISNVL